jgi:hypothetical protein
MLKRVLTAIGVLFLIALLIGGVFLYQMRKAFRAMGSMPKMPDSIRLARIVSGSDLFSKQVFFNEPDLGVITDSEPRESGELVIIGQQGAAFLRDGLFTRNVHFDRCNSDVMPVEVGAGVFLCRATWGSNVKLFDSPGKVLWTFDGGMNGIDDATAGDLGAA